MHLNATAGLEKFGALGRDNSVPTAYDTTPLMFACVGICSTPPRAAGPCSVPNLDQVLPLVLAVARPPGRTSSAPPPYRLPAHPCRCRHSRLETSYNARLRKYCIVSRLSIMTMLMTRSPMQPCGAVCGQPSHVCVSLLAACTSLRALGEGFSNKHRSTVIHHRMQHLLLPPPGSRTLILLSGCRSRLVPQLECPLLCGRDLSSWRVCTHLRCACLHQVRGRQIMSLFLLEIL